MYVINIDIKKVRASYLTDFDDFRDRLMTSLATLIPHSVQSQIWNEGYQEGFERGFEEGKDVGYREAKVFADVGHRKDPLKEVKVKKVKGI